MAFEKLTKERVLQDMPEDLNRYFLREIEKCKTDSPALHYQFAHYLLTK